MLFEGESAILIAIGRLAAVRVVSESRKNFGARFLTLTVCAQGATYGADDLAAMVVNILSESRVVGEGVADLENRHAAFAR